MTSSSADAVACAHCGAGVAGAGARVDAEGRAYCCSGCETVAALIREGGWDAFYERREGASPRPVEQATRSFDLASFADRHVRTLDDGTCETHLRISGLRCAACVWLNEKALNDLDGVEEARVSYGTGLATVRWRPESIPLSAVAERIVTLGYQPQAADERNRGDRDLLMRLGVATFCAANVMLIQAAIYLGGFSGDMLVRYERLFAWAALLLATPAVFYGGAPFFDRAIAGLRHRMVSMDVPIALAITVMYAHALWAIHVHAEPYLDSLTMLIALLLAGQVAVSRGRLRAEEAAERVLSNAPDTAWRRDAQGVTEVGVDAIAEGDTLVAGGGTILVADGVVTAGDGWLDRSHVTGESEPVRVRQGDAVNAGARVVDGQIDVEVTAAPSRSTLARIGTLVRNALQARSPATDLAQRIAPAFTLTVIGVAAVIGAGWTIVAGVDAALPIVVSVLVVACPCALALATPAAVAAGIGAAARHGAFVRDGDALARLAEVDRVAFDKTGTLTEGRPRVAHASDEALRWAAPLEIGSSHPIARAIVEELERRGLPLWRASDVDVRVGHGVRGRVHDRVVEVARGADGGVDVRVDGAVIDTLRFADAARADAAATVRRIDVPVTMLSGDDARVVATVATDLGIADAQGALTPDDKAGWIAARRAHGERVLFAGDGLNDAAALAAADVSVAMGRSSAADLDFADVVVLTDAIHPILAATEAGRATQRVLRRNIRVAILYNVIAVTAAAAGLVGPLVAAILMPFSSALVIGNALSIGRRVDRKAQWTS